MKLCKACHKTIRILLQYLFSKIKQVLALYSLEVKYLSIGTRNLAILFVGVPMFITSVHHKPTFSGVFCHFGSFIPRGYKFNLVSIWFSIAILFVAVWNFSIKRLCNLRRFIKRVDMTISFLTGVCEPF